ncbi:MAG TPA: pyrroline-5-carboxylate reductase [Candidatus Limnocylindrales bacterium]|nr:pyrroline-5-carboxylate reductase [Candidatus Limnocylindrales bacterium]
MDKLDKKIAIIGAGHMGKSLMKGLINSGFKKNNLFVSNKSKDNKNVVLKADWIILAVKPSIISEVIQEIKDGVQNRLLISVAAAVSISNIEKYVGNRNQKIMRIMPNIAVAHNQGVIGLIANENATSTEKQEVISLFSGLGLVVDLKKEKDLDMITLISACSPAIIAHFMEMFSEYGTTHGLSAKDSEKIVLQVFKGTVEYLEKSNLSSSQLKQSVATKGGVTEEIIKSLDNKKVSLNFTESLDKGYQRINKVIEEVKKNE